MKAEPVRRRIAAETLRRYAAGESATVKGEASGPPKDALWQNVAYDPAVHHPILSPQSHWKLLEAGSNPAYLVSHPDLGTHFVKQPIYNPHDLSTDPAARHVLRGLGFHPPTVAKFFHPGAKADMLVGPWEHLTTLHSAIQDGRDLEHLAAVPRQHAANLLTAEWLLHAADRNRGNYGFDGQGGLVPLDYAESFHPLPWESIPPESRAEHSNRLVSPWGSALRAQMEKHQLLGWDHPLDKEFLRHLLTKRNSVIGTALEQVVPAFHSVVDRGNILKLLHEKFATLSALHDQPVPRLKDLPKYKGLQRM